MRETYERPEITRVGSVEDLTLASGTGGLVDICITIGVGGVLVDAGSGTACS